VPGTGFTSIGDYVRANQGTLDRERTDLTDDVNGQIAAAQSSAEHAVGGMRPGQDPTTAPGYLDALRGIKEAQDSAGNLGTTGGLSDLFTKHYGGTTDQGNFDASLFGGGIQSDAQQRAKGIADYLAQHSLAPPPAPPRQHRAPPMTTPGVPPRQPRNRGRFDPLDQLAEDPYAP
jgi:hypothetical protein